MKQTRTRPGRARKSAKLCVLADIASLFGELARMVWTRRLWWLVPLLLALVIVGGLLLLGSSPVAPIFYPLF